MENLLLIQKSENLLSNLFYKFVDSFKKIMDFLTKYILPYVFTILCLVLLITVDIFILVYSQSITISDFTSIFNLLISISFSVFVLSLTIYTLILKLTHGQTIGKYIVSDIRMKRICIIFFLMILSLIGNYIVIFTFNIQVNLIAILLWAMIFIIIIIFLLKNIIIKMVSATTTEDFLVYFIRQAKKVKQPFLKEYKRFIAKEIPKITGNTNQIRENMMRDRIIYDLSNKFLDKDKYTQLHQDALNILIEMQETTKSMNKKIYDDIGRFLVPPHTFGLGSDFIRDNVVIPVKHLYKKYPDFNKGFLWYLESYIIGILDSELLDTILLSEIRKLLPEIESIGYISESRIFDETNDILYRIAKKITTLDIKVDSNIFYHAKDGIIEDIINMVYKSRTIEVNINPYYRTSLMNDTMMSRLRDLCKLEISWNQKTNIINKCIEIVETISKSKSYDYMYGFFSSFQDMWESLLREKQILENREQLMKLPGLHPFTLIPYIRDIVDKFIEMTYDNTIFVIESKQYAISYYPFIKQVNRIIINLAYELFDVFQSTKNDELKTITLNTLQYTHDKLVELGEKLESVEKFDIINYIACPIIVGHFLITCALVNADKEGLKFLENSTKSKFGIKCIFGIKFIIYLYKKANYKYNIDNELFNDLIIENLDELNSIFLRSAKEFEEFKKGTRLIPRSPLHNTDDFLSSIEWRYGKMESKGIMISKHINKILLMLSDYPYQQEINSFIQQLENQVEKD
ncbi:hypothetical protein LCGC14_1136390 [marine sediment metagenome]|uniref:DUF2254 domain-containing protein n=1 Tax=marine sediment metagenome TaxID=412755 RepID=A0A0F9Q5B1_9ZZZZ